MQMMQAQVLSETSPLREKNQKTFSCEGKAYDGLFGVIGLLSGNIVDFIAQTLFKLSWAGW